MEHRCWQSQKEKLVGAHDSWQVFGAASWRVAAQPNEGQVKQDEKYTVTET